MQRPTIIVAAALLAVAAGTARAQVKTVEGKTEFVTVTVEAIDRTTRQLTVKKADGSHEVFYVPDAIKRFDMVKVGDKVTAKYYENMVLQVKAAGEKDIDKTSGGIVRSEDKPSGTASHQRVITATITAIDPNVPSITFSGPQGWQYSSRVKDKNALAKVKVGDKVDITWTEALVLSLDPAK
jgi:hypothetical protein